MCLFWAKIVDYMLAHMPEPSAIPSRPTFPQPLVEYFVTVASRVSKGSRVTSHWWGIADWNNFARKVKVPRSRVTPAMIMRTFHQAVNRDRPTKDTERKQAGKDERMLFSNFQEALLALALMHFPNPRLHADKRLAELMKIVMATTIDPEQV